jgi:predicted transcriptional regulator
MKARAESREGHVTITVSLPPDLHRRLNLAAINQNVAGQELVRRALGEFLDRLEKRTGRKA